MAGREEIVENTHIIKHTVLVNLSNARHFFLLEKPSREQKIRWVTLGNLTKGGEATLVQELSSAALQGKALDLKIASTSEFRLQETPFGPKLGETLGNIEALSIRFD